MLHSPNGKKELSADLVRLHPEKAAPRQIMRYLFTSLFLWGRDQGYQWFDLGVTSALGLDSKSVWQKVARTVFRYAEHFGDPRDLRAFKQEFSPVWKSAYAALPNGWAMPAAMLDASTLASSKQ